MSDAAPATEQISPGQALAAARAELNLSVADVSQQIKYGVKQIAAIEADDYAKLPGTTFVRGMVRSYAKLVQIDPAPLLVELGRRDISAPVTVDLRTSGQEPFVEGGAKSNRVYVWLSLTALLAVAIVAYEWRANPLDTGEVVTITPRGGGDAGEPAVVAPAPASMLAAPMPSAPAQTAPTHSAPTPSEVAPAEPKPAKAPAQAGSPETAAPAAPPAAALRTQSAAQTGGAKDRVSGKNRIELEFDELSWVEVKQANGKILLSQLNPAGSRQVIDGEPPFEVVIGNAANTRLKYNDAQVDLRPYFKVNVARLKLE